MRSLWPLLFLSLAEALSLSDVHSAWNHLHQASPPTDTVQTLANTRIPRRDGNELFAYKAGGDGGSNNVLILIHEFYGLSKSICDKADALAQDMGCTVIAPNTFRGQSYSTFIPKCIWLALTTPQERVNDDLDDVVEWVQQKNVNNDGSIAVMGFCYGGGKAIRYTTERRPNAATVICYGTPLLDIEALARLEKPVCGIFGAKDIQFPMKLLNQFRQALMDANVEQDIRVYDGVGHAFWSDME